MKIKPIIILGISLLFCLLQNPSFAQGANQNEQFKIIKGTVLNSKDNSPLANVTIKLLNSKKGTTSNVDGSFTIQIKKGDKVLEIGTGSGYQTAVLCLLGASVYSIERQNKLFKNASRELPKLGYHPKKMVFGDGYKGLPEAAPFDSIIVTAGAPIIPKALMAQLKIGGRLVIPVGEKEQIMTLLIRKNETQFEKQEYGDFKFVPLLENKN